LYSHSESSRIHALQLEENGVIGEVDDSGLYLDNGATVRGFVFHKAKFLREEKSQMVQVGYKNKRFILPASPHVLVLDSEGFLHHLTYYDTRYTLSNQSILVDPIKVELLRTERLTPTVIANRSMIPSDPKKSMMINHQQSMMGDGGNSGLSGQENRKIKDSGSISHGCFIMKKGFHSLLKLYGEKECFPHAVNSPYLLGNFFFFSSSTSNRID